MDIHQHLAKLLYQSDKVEIPGFGYFVCEVMDTEIHPVEHRFHPKYKKIDFKVSKEVKGEALIEAMVNDGSNALQAKADVANFTQHAIAELKAGKKFQFKHIGFLFIQTGAWVFEQDLSVNYLPESIGLGSFVAKPMLKETPKEAPKVALNPAKEKKKRSMPWGLLTAVFLALVISGAVYWGWSSLQNYWNALGEEQAQVAEQIKPEELPKVSNDTLTSQPADSLAQDSLSAMAADSIDTAVEEELVPEEPVESPVVEHTTIPQTGNVGIYSDKNYYLVAGCFKDELRADEFVQELVNEGFRASKEGTTSGGLHRVVYGGYDTWALAKADIQKVKDTGREGAWIQKNKK